MPGMEQSSEHEEFAHFGIWKTERVLPELCHSFHHCQSSFASAHFFQISVCWQLVQWPFAVWSETPA